MIVSLLIFCICLSLSITQDICTNQAALVLFDEFYLSQDFNSELKLNFSNYISELTKISEDISSFETNALKYDTEAELNEMEPAPLIPYTHDTNLIQIKSLNKELMTSCAARDAKVLDIDPYNTETIKKIMTKLNIDKVPFRTFDDRGAQISSISGSVFKNAPEPSNDNKLLLRFFFPVFSRIGSTAILYPTNDSITETEPVDGLCMKPNNIWDRPGPSRNKWLTLINKIISNIAQIKSWKESFTTLFSNLPIIDQLYGKTTDILTPNTPLPLAGIANFLNKYKTNSNWESSTISALSEFQTFIKNFRTLSRVFMKLPPLRTRDSLVTNITEARITELVAAPFDNDRIQRFLDLHPDKVNITGPISIKPLYKIRGQEGIIGAQAALKIYDAKDKVKIYHVKPLVYQGFVTTATHVVITSRNKIALTQTPTPYGCQPYDDDTRKDESIRVCKGYTTPGLEKMSSINSNICGVALSTIKGEIDFTKCPLERAPSAPLAYRVSCGNRSVVISSNKKLKIRVFCDGSSGTDVTLLESFPVYLQTECEIRQVEGGGFEPTLLPQLHSDFLIQQPLASIEQPPESVKVTEILKPASVNTTLNNTLTSPPLVMEGPFFIASVVSFCTFGFGSLVCLLVKRKLIWKLFIQQCACCSRKYNPCGCRKSKCCKLKCCKISCKSPSSESNSDSEQEIEMKVSKKNKKKSKKSNKSAASSPLLNPPSVSAPAFEPDPYLEPENPSGPHTPVSARSIQAGLNAYGKQQPRPERYNNTYIK